MEDVDLQEANSIDLDETLSHLSYIVPSMPKHRGGTSSTSNQLNATDEGPSTSFADERRRWAAEEASNSIPIPTVPQFLCNSFLDDYLSFFYPLTGTSDQSSLRLSMSRYMEYYAPINEPNDSKGSPLEFIPRSAAAEKEGEGALSSTSLTKILLILSIGASMHATSMQCTNRIRDYAILRVYKAVKEERKLSKQPARQWLNVSFCLGKSAELYTAARFILLGMENEMPTIDRVRCYRMFATANQGQNSWMGFNFGSLTLSTALAMGMQKTTIASLKGEFLQDNDSVNEIRALYILSVTSDLNAFRFSNLVTWPPIVDRNTIERFARLDPFLAQHLLFDSIAHTMNEISEINEVTYSILDQAGIDGIRKIVWEIETKLNQSRQLLPQDSPLEVKKENIGENTTLSIIRRVYICIHWTSLRLKTFRSHLNLTFTNSTFKDKWPEDIVLAIRCSSEAAMILANALLTVFDVNIIFFAAASRMLGHLQRCSVTLLLCIAACRIVNCDLFDNQKQEQWLEIISSLAKLVKTFSENGNEISLIHQVGENLIENEKKAQKLIRKNSIYKRTTRDISQTMDDDEPFFNQIQGFGQEGETLLEAHYLLDILSQGDQSWFSSSIATEIPWCI